MTRGDLFVLSAALIIIVFVVLAVALLSVPNLP
jgi:hypothetical protein